MTHSCAHVLYQGPVTALIWESTSHLLNTLEPFCLAFYVDDYCSMLCTQARPTAGRAVGACCVSHATIANAQRELLYQQNIMTDLCVQAALLQCARQLQRL